MDDFIKCEVPGCDSEASARVAISIGDAPKRMHSVCSQHAEAAAGPALDPHKTICVCKHNGKEVGRVPATAPNAEAYMTELATYYGNLQVDYE